MYSKTSIYLCKSISMNQLRCCKRALFTLSCVKTNTSILTNTTCTIHSYNRKLNVKWGNLSNLRNLLMASNTKTHVAGIRSTAFIYQFANLSTVSNSTMFSLNDYDCIGFDLDNTICEYNISACVKMEYEALASLLVENRQYDPHNLMKPLDANSYDFLQKGLLVDFAKGNLLKIDVNGQIIKCSHGTRFMTEKEIVDSYGEDKKWDVTSHFCKNMVSAVNGPLSEQMRALLDYFDMPASLAFARIVDSLDDRLGGVAEAYNIWPDILACLHIMYDRQNFSKAIGGYFNKIKANPEEYIKPCNLELIDWLKNIKKSKLIFLITGSHCDFASFTAEAGLGNDWRNLFDIVVCYARKPGFFHGCRPFISLNGFTETNPINGRDLKLGNMYSQGNWQELYQLFSAELSIKEPRCLYFGDNLIQDVLAPSEYTKCDTVSIVEELVTEYSEKQMRSYNLRAHPSEAVLTSKHWGSYLFGENNQHRTVWEGVIRNHSKICIPSLSALVRYPITHKFNQFNKNSPDGYFPVVPCS